MRASLLSGVEQMIMDMMFTASSGKQGKDEEKYKQQGLGRCSYPELKPRRVLQYRKSPPPQSNQMDSFAYIYTFDPPQTSPLTAMEEAPGAAHTALFLECTQPIYCQFTNLVRHFSVVCSLLRDIYSS